MTQSNSHDSRAETNQTTTAEEGREVGEAIYRAERITKDYVIHSGSISVLKGVEFQIHRGEIISVVGMSGVGKSTLLNILGLLDTPTSGRLVYRGRDESLRDRDLTTLNARRRAEVRNREFGFVFQFYHLLPDLSVLENVLLPAMISHRGGAYRKLRKELTARANALLEQVGIASRRDFSPTRLSGGERQRAAIARALMNEPEILFCDEPTGNLDTATGEKIHKVLLELNRSTAVALVLVTHEGSLANLADRKLSMRDGLFVEA